MNYSDSNTKYESTFAQMYVFLVLLTIFAFYHERCLNPKLQKLFFQPEIGILGQKYSHTRAEQKVRGIC